MAPEQKQEPPPPSTLPQAVMSVVRDLEFGGIGEIGEGPENYSIDLVNLQGGIFERVDLGESLGERRKLCSVLAIAEPQFET
jgi:hypothetical protein